LCPTRVPRGWEKAKSPQDSLALRPGLIRLPPPQR
jgi:hypothetical protein